MQALLTAAKAEKSSTVQKAYAQAAATVCKYAAEARVAKLVEEAVQLFNDPGMSHDAEYKRIISDALAMCIHMSQAANVHQGLEV